MKILVTGFEPFLSLTRNPSKEVLPMLEKEVKRGSLKTMVLPVVFDQVFDPVKEAIEDFKPDVILHLGVAESRDKISLERVAINIKDARGVDNLGNQPVDEPILKRRASAYFSTLPLRKLEAILKDANIPVEISNSAGTYVCNNIMYHTLSYLEEEKLDVMAGFIHLPMMKDQDKGTNKSMELSMIKEGIMRMIEYFLNES